MKRHGELLVHCANPLSYCQSYAVCKESLESYFTLLKQTLEKNDLMSSKRIEKGIRGSSGNKTQITILACANAMGNMLSPMVIFKGKHFNQDWVKREAQNALYGMSPNGWIDQELFTEWLQKLFIPNIISARLVLLLLDGHSYHFSPRIAAEANIILFCLLLYTTYVAQPLDVSFFGPLKKH